MDRSRLVSISETNVHNQKFLLWNCYSFSDSAQKDRLIYKTTCHFEVSSYKQTDETSLATKKLPITGRYLESSNFGHTQSSNFLWPETNFNYLEQICKNRSTQFERLKRRYQKQTSHLCLRHATSLLQCAENWKQADAVSQQIISDDDSLSFTGRQNSVPVETQNGFVLKTRLCQNCSSNDLTSNSSQGNIFQTDSYLTLNGYSQENVRIVTEDPNPAKRQISNDLYKDFEVETSDSNDQKFSNPNFFNQPSEKSLTNQQFDNTAKLTVLEVPVRAPSCSSCDEDELCPIENSALCNRQRRRPLRVSSESGYSTQNGDHIAEKMSDGMINICPKL